MHVNVMDYLVARVTEKRKALVRAKAPASKDEDWPIQVVVSNEKQDSDEAETFEVELADVLANLGEYPQDGSVHGVKIEPWHETIRHKFWGDIHIYREMKAKEKDHLVAHLDRCSAGLKNKHLDGFLPIRMEIRPRKGSYAGHYKSSKDIDEIVLHPKDMVEDTGYVIFHESGHGVWFRQLSTESKARWVKLYHQCVKLIKANPDTANKLVIDFCSSRVSIKDFKANLRDTDSSLFDEMLGWARKVHRLRKEDFDTMISAGWGEELQAYFPTGDIMISEIESVITDYAMKNPDEFFAEAFAFYLQDRPLPVSVKKLMRSTIAELGGGTVEAA